MLKMGVNDDIGFPIHVGQKVREQWVWTLTAESLTTQHGTPLIPLY